MKHYIYKHIILFFQKTSIMVGGQAIMEGVMMRVPGFYATAVRNKNNQIEVERHAFQPTVEVYKLENIFLVRGFLHLIDSMKIGFKSLEWSSKIAEENKTNKIVDFIMSAIAIGFAITLFMGVPYYLTNIGLSQQSQIQNNNFSFNIIAGSLRLIIFIFYLFILSKLKDIKRLFQYHGAEHKAVYNFESGLELHISNAKNFSTLHPRCGTSFVFILMFVTIGTYSVIDTMLQYYLSFHFTLFTRIIAHLLFLPVVTGLGYEVLKFLAKNQTNQFCLALSKPGLWLQKITTKEPDLQQLEVAIIALQTAFGKDMTQFKQGQKFQADAIG